MLAVGNTTLATTLNGSPVESLAVAAFATGIGLAGLFSWRWFLASASAERLADVQISE
jgi:hypothetical protein